MSISTRSLYVSHKISTDSFNVLKNGCCVEELQLDITERIERALVLFVIVAWRIAHLMCVGKASPGLDATPFSDPNEIHSAHLLMKKRMPEDVLKLNVVLRLIAQCAGFLARKGDGEPGGRSHLQSLERVMTAAETLRALRYAAV